MRTVAGRSRTPALSLSVSRLASLVLFSALAACSGGGGGSSGGGGGATVSLEAPTGLAVLAGSAVVDLSWEPNAEPGVIGYRVHRTTLSGTDFVELTSEAQPETSYQDSGLVNGTTYYYTVTAEDGEGVQSPPSAEISATPEPSSDASLASLQVSGGELFPAFDPELLEYSVGPVGLLTVSTLLLSAAATDGAATVRLDGELLAPGEDRAIDLPVGVTPLLLEVTAESGATRSYTVLCRREGPSAQADYLKASNTGAGDALGVSFTIDGDTLVVGAYHEGSAATGVDGDGSSDAAPQSGAAYVYGRSGGVWVEQAYLKASNAEEGDFFGRSLALDGDTLVVGAYHESSAATTVDGDEANNGAKRSGAAYVFTRAAGVWSQEAYLKASNAEAGDFFGRSVDISGDTIVVGAYGEDSAAAGVDADQSSNTAPFCGAAYVFARDAGSWTQQAYLKASNAGNFDYFGISVAIDADTLVVGAYGEWSSATGVGGDQGDNGAFLSGAAYVFTRDAGSWSQEAYLKASNTEQGDQFGSAVALSGDTLVVGAPEEDSEATGVDGDGAGSAADGSGAAYVFTRSAGVWSQEAYLKASNTGGGDRFGDSVAVLGNAILVGAPGEGSSATGLDGDGANDDAAESGAAEAFTRTAGAWSPLLYLKASNTEAGDAFGSSVGLDGEVLVVGAPGEASSATGGGGDQADNGAPGAGALYTFE